MRLLLIEDDRKAALANILDNAVKFSPSGGRVTIAVAAARLTARRQRFRNFRTLPAMPAGSRPCLA